MLPTYELYLPTGMKCNFQATCQLMIFTSVLYMYRSIIYIYICTIKSNSILSSFKFVSYIVLVIRYAEKVDCKN